MDTITIPNLHHPLHWLNQPESWEVSPEGQLTIMAPAKTPQAIVTKLNREITDSFNQAETKEAMLKLGALAQSCAPAPPLTTSLISVLLMVSAVSGVMKSTTML